MTREEAIQVLTDIKRIRSDKIAEAIDMAIEALSSAEAVQGWRIGKPTEQGSYMVTLDSFGHKHIDLFYYGKPLMPNRKVRGKCWYRSDDEWGDVVYDDTDILAWMPLPTPANLKEEFESAECEDYEHATLVDIKEPLKVLVVRCKDCKHQRFYINDKESFHCDKSGIVNMHIDDGDGEFFCKYGERREPTE